MLPLGLMIFLSAVLLQPQGVAAARLLLTTVLLLSGLPRIPKPPETIL
jgi:hypothetical protein